MACPDCFNNCDKPQSDQCVVYTGDDIPALGICNGDPLSKLENAVVSTLLQALAGTNILLSDVTLENCSWLQSLFIGKSQNLVNLLQLLIDSNCTLKQLIDQMTPGPVSFDTVCLSDLPASPTATDILQSAVKKLCSISSVVDSFPSLYVKQSDVTTLVTNIISGSGSSSGIPNYKDRMVPYVAQEYYGPISNFDNNGVGIDSLGFSKIYICNGSNNTPDKRGRVAVGAVRNVPGGSLDSAVDPNNINNPNTNYAVGDKFGENYHQLTNAEAPVHTHTINDQGHSHDYNEPSLFTNPDGGGTPDFVAVKNGKTGIAQTGITLGNSGGGSAHNNRQPSIAANYIMYIP